MSNPAKELDLLQKANNSGSFSKLFTYSKISGPGIWLALAALSAGSLVGSIGIGQRLGLEGLWVQAWAMCLGMFMLWTICHISLNTQQSLFSLLRKEWNPSLGWWLAGSAMVTNFAWCMPQFRFGADITGSILLPFLDNKGGKVGVAFFMLAVSIFLSFWYERSGFQSKLLQWILRVMLWGILGCLLLSVFLALSNASISLLELMMGFWPSPSHFNEVTNSYLSLLNQCGEFRDFWEDKILSQQKELTLVTFSSTLGVNLLFALPLLLLGRGWRREHNGFAKFNLFTGLLIPFLLCSSCLTILSAIAHNQLLHSTEVDSSNTEKFIIDHTSSPIHDLLAERIKIETGQKEYELLPPFKLEQRIEALPFVEKKLARLVTQTDTKPLIAILSKTFAPNIKYLFGISVLLISFSTIVILMILNGHLVCEVLGKAHKGAPFQSGSMILALSSVGPFVWSDQDNWVADPSYFLSLAILPYALLSFLLMLNSKELLGRQRPKGLNGVITNAGSLIAFLSLGATSFYLVWNHTWKDVPIGKILVVLLGILILVGYFSLKNKKLSNRIAGLEARFESLNK